MKFFNHRIFAVLFFIFTTASASIASIELDDYPMSTVFYLSSYTNEQMSSGTWEQFPSHRKDSDISFLNPDTPKKLVIISHAPGASRFAHTWLVPNLIEDDNIVVCIEHRFFNIHELDFKELYSNILARPYEIDIVAKNIIKHSNFKDVVSPDSISLITVDDSSIAGLLLTKAQLESLKIKEHQKRYAVWNLWGPKTSKDMAQVDWAAQTVMPTTFNLEHLVLINPKGKQCAYAQSLNQINTPTLIISRNRTDIADFHDEIEYLSTHIKNSRMVELPQDLDESIFYNKCGNPASPLISPSCLASDSNKEGVQQEISEKIANFINTQS